MRTAEEKYSLPLSLFVYVLHSLSRKRTSLRDLRGVLCKSTNFLHIWDHDMLVPGKVLLDLILFFVSSSPEPQRWFAIRHFQFTWINGTIVAVCVQKKHYVVALLRLNGSFTCPCVCRLYINLSILRTTIPK